MNENEYNSAIGARIKDARKAQKITLKELGKSVGLSESTTKRYEDGQIKGVDVNILKKFAAALDVSPAWLMGYDVDMKPAAFEPLPIPHMVKIPILGTVVAGEPLMSEENILGYEEIPEKLARIGDMFGLYVRGDSMTPTMQDGDVIIVRHQTYANSGDIAVVLVNGDEATVKEIKFSDDGLTLIGHNATVFPPRFYTAKEVQYKPVTICGVVYSVHRNLKKF